LAFIYIRKEPGNSENVLGTYKGSATLALTNGGQGCFPINAQRSFQYGLTLASTSTTIRLIGYY
jgi:hypothetical protein